MNDVIVSEIATAIAVEVFPTYTAERREEYLDDFRNIVAKVLIDRNVIVPSWWPLPDDERSFLVAIRDGSTVIDALGKTTQRDGDPRQIASSLGIDRERAADVLNTWTERGWYDWGTSIDLGWLLVSYIPETAFRAAPKKRLCRAIPSAD